MKSNKKENKRKKYNKACYVIGSIAFYAMAILVIPRVMTYISGAMYKHSLKSSRTKNINNERETNYDLSIKNTD